MPVAGERSHWAADDAPIVLSPLPGSEFQFKRGAQALALDHKNDGPGDDAGRHQEEIWVRETNPDPGVWVGLVSRDGTEKKMTGAVEGLDDSGVGQIADWVDGHGSGDALILHVDSPAITRQEIGRLGNLADEHDLSVEINLRADG